MNIEKELINSGYKLTSQRLKIVKQMQKEKGLISARDLFKKIKDIDLASVYRTLNLLEELKIINTETGIGKEKLYCLKEYHHHHIICRKCGYAEEIKCDEKKYRNIKNFSDIYHHLTLTGVCLKCNP